MERKSCCGSRSYVSTPKKETVAATPKKEEDVKPDIPKGNVDKAVPSAAPAAAADAAVKAPKTEEKETVSVKKETVKANSG
ncbi:hypothetical protein DITRI_Ditri06bG0173800 [Diplodiscus trichospermus]